MKFSISVSLERFDPRSDMRRVAAQALELVQIAEQGGFEIAWTPEHHTIEFTIAPNPFTILTHWAAHTRTIRLGTAVVVAPYWHPIRVAGEAALCDVLSNGRLEFGIGRGAYQFEFDRMAGGIPQTEGGAFMREMLPVLKSLWEGDHEHRGRYWSFPLATAVPKPVQKPHPPIWVAARDAATFDWAIKQGANIQATPLSRPNSEVTVLGKRFGEALAANPGQARPHFLMLRRTCVYEDPDEWVTPVRTSKGYCDSFAAKTGATVIQDGPVDYAKLRTMIQNGSPTWDVVDVTIDFLYNAAKDGLFEKIDASIVDTNLLPPKYVHEYGIANIVWSYNIAFNTQTFTDGKHPKTWSEFLDVEKFPGRRALRDRVNPMLEIALLADGVPFEKLYPLDVDRALKRLEPMKKNAVWWTTNSQSQQLMIDGECSLGILNNGRIYDAVQKGAKIGIEWAQNLQSVDYLVVPKGSKVKDAAMGLIAEMMLPNNQATVSNIMPLAPTNPEAFKLIKKEIAPWLSTEPANIAQGFPINEEYWRDNYKALAERWVAWKLA